MKIDLRQLAIAKLWANYNKKLNSEKMKQAIRDNDITTIHNDYATITLDKYTRTYYSAEDQAKIDEFIKENHIEKITETKENYAIEIKPTQKAELEFNKILQTLENSNDKTTKRIATKTEKEFAKMLKLINTN